MKTRNATVNGAEGALRAGVPIVGIGTSPGGLDALECLLPLLKFDMGLAYVVVQHLDPKHAGLLPSLLAKYTRIPVVEVRDRVMLERDRIYIIPPNASLTLSENRLNLSMPPDRLGQRSTIDGFFTSLAEARGEFAAGVILTGTGSDGTVGLRAIKEGGGLTIAQKDADYDGMMRGAVGSGMVDVVLPLEKIPAQLYDYFQHLGLVGGRKGLDGLRSETVNHLGQIYAILRSRTGHDFSGYKNTTVARRVQRRMQVLGVDEVSGFIERLRVEPKEVEALMQDLLIGVTSFFRDPEAFEVLGRDVIPALFEGKGLDDTVRVWVPGCSTGEEAYSIGMLLREHQVKTQSAAKLQVFASDIDEQALQIARYGRYPSTIGRDLSQARLERHFVREDGTYRITPELREICLFSAQNVLRDAPFSRLDLISCRNLLIYLTTDLQNRLIPLFHHALNESGYLFLGSSENIARHSRLFSTADKPHRIFLRRPQGERRQPVFPVTPLSGKRRRLSDAGVTFDRNSLQGLAERQLLDCYSPAYVVINGRGELLHGSARTGKYLELAASAPSVDIYGMARTGLRPDLRVAIRKAMSTGQVSIQRRVAVGTDGGLQIIDLIVHPIRPTEAAEPLYMVAFLDVGGIEAAPDANAAEGGEAVARDDVRHLEIELKATRDRMQLLSQELEASNEELKLGNEELSSMNEELQSANEELETSKEELQSINEELHTVNAELNARVEELSRANFDIANLLESTQIATVFLDRELAVKGFTPAAKDVFRLVESDTGRPITHVRTRFHCDTIEEDVERVMSTMATIERQVESNYNDARYIMRMMPYRATDSVISGVVITFVDVTKIVEAERRIKDLTNELRHRIQNLETLLNLVPVGVMMIVDNTTDEVRVNRYVALLVGETPDGGREKQPSPICNELHIFQGERELGRMEQPLYRAAHSAEFVVNFECQVAGANGKRVDVVITATPLYDDSGKVRGGIAAILDVSERRAAESHQQILLYELQHRVKNIITTIGALATRMLKGNLTLQEFSGSFLGRLRAMAATHDLLSRGNWTGASMAALIEMALQPHLGKDSSAVKLNGDDLVLAPACAATLGLVFYELATNAMKYGALSMPEGGVDVTWRVEAADGTQVVVQWVERGGPALAEPPKAGFGAGFVQRSIEYELGGTAKMRIANDGLRWEIAFPLEDNVQQEWAPRQIVQ